MAETIKRAYESEGFSEREQKDINNARARAVRQAWIQEKQYVKDGMGTRDWTPEQQEDLLKNTVVSLFLFRASSMKLQKKRAHHISVKTVCTPQMQVMSLSREYG